MSAKFIVEQRVPGHAWMQVNKEPIAQEEAEALAARVQAGAPEAEVQLVEVATRGHRRKGHRG